MKCLTTAHIIVVKPGWFTTVQDLGRYGYQHFGVSASGAMDKRSCILANRLVGNPDEAATLELTLQGPELLFENEAVIALCGADLMPFLDGTVVPLWTSIAVRAGSRLTFGTRRTGARCYFALAGGIDVPIIMGSRSTHIASQTGGLNGRVLTQGDVLTGGMPISHQREMTGRLLPQELRPSYASSARLRILPGPQQTAFSDEAFELLLSTPYRLSSNSDRMGYRLEGSKLIRGRLTDMITDGTAMGAVQVPPDEQPILLMADRQTTGGYPKIAAAISADLHFAGQLLPGDTVKFLMTTPAEAQGALKADWQAIDAALPQRSLLN